MICSRFQHFLIKNTAFNTDIQYRCIATTRLLLKQCRINEIFASIAKNNKDFRMMSSVRLILRDLGINTLRSVWTRSVNVGCVVRRYRRDKYVRDVIQCFRQAFFRPRRTLLLSATAAYKVKTDDDEKPSNSEKEITDEELEALVSELDAVEELSQATLYCPICNKRLVIEKKQPGVSYCLCKNSHPGVSKDGWEPYLEAEDVVIWRKEYKPGHGLYAYKVYGRYKEVTASHFAAVQVDSGYRRVWDSAVAALAVVERSPSIPDQAILHWEVLWPRLFANRDYVYIRRHKEYSVDTKSTHSLFEDKIPAPAQIEERESVHSNAKRKAIENYSRVCDSVPKRNKVYIIVSKSCTHPKVPESKHAIRVSEYWSHMVVRTLDGVDNPGMEFVLTYYDEPAVGGLPSGVATWATGRAAPNYLNKMRAAAGEYPSYKQTDPQDPSELPTCEPENVSFDGSNPRSVSEAEMESSKQGPDMENVESGSKDQSTQTEVLVASPKEDKAIGTSDNDKTESPQDSSKSDDDKEDTSPEEVSSRWWRYLHPFYYFV